MKPMEKQRIANQLAGYETTSSILWLVVAIIQILSIYLIIAGIWNLFAAIGGFNTATKIRNMDPEVPSIFEGITWLVIFGVINFLFGGVIGIALIIFDIWIRSQILANKNIFVPETKKAKIIKKTTKKATKK